MVDGVLGQARAGASGVLVVAGEPGVGKSALLEYAVESASASGFQVVRASGTEWEMELAFAGLQQLCAPLLDGVAQLPGPQRAAIETARSCQTASQSWTLGQCRRPPSTRSRALCQR